MPGLRRKDSVQIALICRRPVDRIVRPLPPVMLSQCPLQTLERLHFAAGQGPRRFPRQVSHNLLHIFELSLGTPSCVLPPPLFAGLEPNSERFGKILGGVSLGVPGVKIENIIAAAGLWLIPLGIRNVV